jgi:hypothetical protein
VGLPVGFTFHVGGDNNEYVTLNDQWRDIPEMIPLKFGGPGMTGYWNFRAFGYLLTGSAAGQPLEIELWSPSVGQIAVGTILTQGILLQGPWGSFDRPVVVPGGVVDLFCRCRAAGGTINAVVGHCLLYKSQTGIRNES